MVKEEGETVSVDRPSLRSRMGVGEAASTVNREVLQLIALTKFAELIVEPTQMNSQGCTMSCRDNISVEIADLQITRSEIQEKWLCSIFPPTW